MISRVVSAPILAMLAVMGAKGETMVVLETELGDIAIEVYEERAPISSASFLDHVDGGYFEGGAFWRTVTTENDNGSPIIEVIQGGVIGEVTDLPTVEHESTRDSGILHQDGVVSLGRSDPGTASGASFFICIGEQPALDFGATRNPDGLGFAAFGRVVDGMDVVRAIHRRDANAPSEDPYTDGQLLTEYVTIASAYRQDSADNE
ncbi:MAG: peptidylprolyl isomerase [Rhodospirillaceae bacterium]|nr:peptidylprolyl isomerase [Rhodospirillaceae bacterium]MDD9998020.1 peptidylprolyl isomerase [Rhodospirillaceae bacterium]MDE0360815.1 peptidylprolyl isomerase [Rhodospirillaceae bacterium]